MPDPNKQLLLPEIAAEGGRAMLNGQPVVPVPRDLLMEMVDGLHAYAHGRLAMRFGLDIPADNPVVAANLRAEREARGQV